MGVLPTSPTNMDSCIEILLKCARACEESFDMSLQQPDIRERADCLKILTDCAEMCAMTARFMSRNSEFNKELCYLTMDVCQTCAEECNRFKDQHSQGCAEICLQCIDECKRIVAGMTMV
ncbi:four-helix bundle copper-binding protein [Proteinivorax hydrogeniformans]|uniref:Four-helix bundle copper-binding protein n=1 Tax=Proteinivorax hydrogeniformans TaxID=1826727 RepID=A0AAU8HSI3_9FIRM